MTEAISSLYSSSPREKVNRTPSSHKIYMVCISVIIGVGSLVAAVCCIGIVGYWSFAIGVGGLALSGSTYLISSIYFSCKQVNTPSTNDPLPHIPTTILPTLNQLPPPPSSTPTPSSSSYNQHIPPPPPIHSNTDNPPPLSIPPSITDNQHRARIVEHQTVYNEIDEAPVDEQEADNLIDPTPNLWDLSPDTPLTQEQLALFTIWVCLPYRHVALPLAPILQQSCFPLDVATLEEKIS